MNIADVITSVVTMLVVDGVLQQQELDFLNRLCERLKVPVDTIDRAFEAYAQGNEYVYLPQNEGGKKLLINYLLEAIVADELIAPEEYALLQTIGVRLGISQDHLDDALAFLLTRSKERHCHIED